MKKKLLGIVILVALVLYVTRIDDPLNSLVSFVIAGVVPGTNIMLGLWPTLGVGMAALWLVSKLVKYVRLQMLEHTANQITAEKLKAQFEENSQHEFEYKNKAVIAARGSELIV